jgi:transposase
LGTTWQRFYFAIRSTGIVAKPELAGGVGCCAMRVASKRLWRRIAHYVPAAREQEIMTDVRVIGIDETSLKRGQDYVTVVHDLKAKQLLFMTVGRRHDTVHQF